MPFKDAKYKYNQTIIKLFENPECKKIKVIRMNVLRTAGVEDDNDKRKHSARGSVNEEKLENNIIRAKNKIFELAFCNPWDWFFTGTLNSEFYNRADLKKFKKDLSQYIRNYNRKYQLDIDYLLIPELHSDGVNWHIHGLIHGLPAEHLQRFQIGDKIGKALSKKVRRGDIVYNWSAYAKKFGFCDLEPIMSVERLSKYITKYINKSLFNSVRELNANLYYRSCGLKTAKTLKKGVLLVGIPPDHKNEYCSISWLDYDETLIQELLNSFAP